MSTFIGMKLRDVAVSEAAKIAINYVPGATAQEKQLAKSVINGVSIVKTFYDVADLICDKRKRRTYPVYY